MRRRRADGLFDGIATFGALCAAASRAALGKRRGPGPAAFLANLETEVLVLERELRAGTWRPGGYVTRRRTWRRRRRRRRSSGSSCGPAVAVGCRSRTCGGSATACAGSATAGGREISLGEKWSSGFAPGWRTRRTPTRGGCAARSSGTGGSRLAGNRSRGPDRPPAVVWFAAAPGTTMPRTSGLARATGTPPATGTTTRVFAFRARPGA